MTQTMFIFYFCIFVCSETSLLLILYNALPPVFIKESSIKIMVSSKNTVAAKTFAVILHQLASAFASVNKVRLQLLVIIHKKQTVDHMIRIYLKTKPLRRRMEEAVFRKVTGIKKNHTGKCQGPLTSGGRTC